jgi:hypothetical protein
MNVSKRLLVSIGPVLTVAALAVILLVAAAAGVAAQPADPYFDVWKHEDPDQDGFDNFDRDPPLEGWHFTVQFPAGVLFDQGSTNENGNVQFHGILRGETYLICEMLKDGWINLEPGGDGCMSVPVPPNQNGPIELVFLNYREPVGGETEPANRRALLAPWLGLGAVIVFLGIAASALRRRAGST